ncbi:voltage-dependent anion-selective channel-like [Scaptodrosophila lebanonensis]|uniref:Voltage-dependent anion-selective channel-like n=1 Tax=Drosophila lebanonensis TaxID=7225 RepID=A0A6J2U957_DROLE|nr:voltage-dependent anion-selective channel-like [Scaptodrosophila lebanonensis]
MAEEGGETQSVEEEEEILLPPPVEDEMPTFFHIGSCAKDCLITGYKIGVWHADTSSESKGLILKTYGDAKPDKKSISGGLELRKIFEGLELAQGWNTDQRVSTEITWRKPMGPSRLLASILAKYNLEGETGLAATLKLGYDQRPYKFEVIVPVIQEPKLMGYFLAVPAQKWTLGYRTVYDMENKGFDKHALCVGYNNGSTELGLKFENFEDWRGSIFQRMGERWAFALKANCYKNDSTKFAFGGQYQLNEDTLLKAKVRDDGLMGLIYQSKVSDSIKVTYHLGFEGKHPLDGEHKIGVSWSLNC